MPPKKKSRDEIQDALAEVLNVTGMPMPTGVLEELLKRQAATTIETSKNPAAVALGRLGGLKGGKARAEALSAKERSAIAGKGARKRWAEWNELKRAGLTSEEIKIARLVKKGQTSAEIATTLGLSSGTIQRMRKRLFAPGSGLMAKEEAATNA